MEKFYRITDKKIVDQYISAKANEEIYRKAIQEFKERHEIETSGYYYVPDALYLCLNSGDKERFESSLKKYSSVFKKTSKEHKEFMQILKDKGFSQDPKQNKLPSFMFLINSIGRVRTSTFLVDNIVYLQVIAEDTPRMDPKIEHEEIKGSEFYRIYEEVKEGYEKVSE